MAQITLTYSVDFSPLLPLSANQISTKLAVPTVAEGELDLLGYTVNSDTVGIVGNSVRRVIVLDTTATSDSLFPTNAAREASVKGLYKEALNLKLPGLISESIVITP